MTPRHLVPIEPANAVRDLCERIAISIPDGAVTEEVRHG
jgi:hypothetical protein